MPLSKARDRARKRLEYREKHGLPLLSNPAFSVLPPDKRKEVLAQVALHAIETPVSAGHKIAAIKEINLMEHIYEPGGNVRDVNVVFIIGRGYRDVPQIVEGKVIAEQSTT